MNNTVFILKDIFYLLFFFFGISLKTFKNHKFKCVAMISNNVKLLVIKRLSIFIEISDKSTVYMKYINYSTKRVET